MKYQLRGKHKWKLPGVRCPACTTWGSIGTEYPAVEPPANIDEAPYTSGWPVSPEELEALRRPIRDLFPERGALPPGTRFGRFVGSARGVLPDFAWPNGWSVFLKRSAFEALKAEGIKIVGVEAEIIWKGKKIRDLLELQAEPFAALARASLPRGGAPPCSVCGRREISAPRRVSVTAESIPEGFDVFRGLELTTYIFCTERFKETVECLGLSGVAFEKVRVEQPGGAAGKPKRKKK